MPNLDAFGRLRVSSPTTLFDVNHLYDTQTFYWDTFIANGGTETYLPNESSVELSVTTASGSVARRTTREYFRYQPGKSQLIKMTGVMGAHVPNREQNIGIYSDNDGLMFRVNSNGWNVVERSSVTGSMVETVIPQSSWNGDKLNGRGKSRHNLDDTKAHIFFIDFQWLGVGDVRFGVIHNGEYLICHTIHHDNIVTAPYIGNPNLPVRYEIKNTGVTTTPGSLKQICCVVLSEGGVNPWDQPGIIFSAANEVFRSVGNSAFLPLMSIRPVDTFNGKTNYSLIYFLNMSLYTASREVLFKIIYGGNLVSPNFTNVNDKSKCQTDVSASAISGGYTVDSFFADRGDNASFLINSKLSLSRNTPAGNNVVITVAAKVIGTGTSDSGVSLTWKEVY